jgi:hypothetical protein
MLTCYGDTTVWRFGGTLLAGALEATSTNNCAVLEDDRCRLVRWNLLWVPMISAAL